MRIFSITFLLAVVASFFIGCNSEGGASSASDPSAFKVSPTGVQYKLFPSDTEGARLQPNDVVNVHYELWVGDTMITNTRTMGTPMPVQIFEPATGAGPDVNEVYVQAHEYDSVVVRLPLDSLPEEGKAFKEYNPEATFLELRVKMLGKFDEGRVIKKYIQDNEYDKLDHQTLDDGVQVFRIAKGDGPQISVGDSIVAHLRAKVISTGKVFSDSWENGQPMGFRLNEQGVLPGLVSGLTQLKQGDHAVLILPYSTAFGPGGQPMAGIPPYAPISFEVKVLEVHKD